MRIVSHYEVLEKLGEGGMGVVWKGRDTRLDRFVAIKFLPADKTSDPERKRRFAQEARAVSALNHPRIVTVYDIDHADGEDFIVMEFVAGKTLEQLIPAKGMKVSDAVRYAMQIADALAAAHAIGIVHRDLKPANVIVSDSGQVKVLDFGLAKLQEESASSEVEFTRTIVQEGMTEAGTIVGTTSYMSPEQAEGKRLDARSDIFAFGSVLYEMLSGKRAFRADSKMSTLAAIIRADPEPLEKLTPAPPRDLIRIVQRCLRKDPEDRAQSMADLRVALKDLKEESESGLLVGASAPPRRKSRAAWILVAALAAAGIAGGAAYLWKPAKTSPEPPLQATLLTSYPGLEKSPSFSPDGNQVAFAWGGEKGDNVDIYVKLLGPGKPLRLTTNPEVDHSPAWSPDGRWIAFIRKNSLMLVPPIGGTERELMEGLFPSTRALGAYLGSLHWSPDSRWLVASVREIPGGPLALFLISAETGEKRKLTTPPKGSNGDYHGSISPDGKTLAFSRMPVLGSEVMSESDLYLLPLETDYSPRGEIRRLTNEKVLTGGIAWTADSRELVFSWFKGGSFGLWRIVADGSQPPVKLTVGDSGTGPTISHSGRRLAFEFSLPDDLNIWRMNPQNPAEPAVSLIASTRPEQSAQYSPDGQKIAFSSERSGPSAIWVCDADGSNPLQLTTMNAAGSPAWSPDGRRIVFDGVIESHWQVFTIAARGGKPQQLTSGAVGHTRPSWSHDAQWIYAAGGGGIRKIPAGGGSPVQLTSAGGTNPVESVDGKTVYYQKEAAVWRVGADGSGDRRAIDSPAYLLGIAATQDGIYYLAPAPNRGVWFFSFASGHSRLIRKLDRPPGLGISVTPDGKSLIYSQRDTDATGDLMLVDPFH